MLVAFSCRGRSFCPSCEKKRQLLWAKWLRKEVLAQIAHRHVVLTIGDRLKDIPLFWPAPTRSRVLPPSLAVKRAGPWPKS